MNVHMYEHPAVKRNIETLKQYGYTFIGTRGRLLACGYVGKAVRRARNRGKNK